MKLISLLCLALICSYTFAKKIDTAFNKNGTFAVGKKINGIKIGGWNVYDSFHPQPIKRIQYLRDSLVIVEQFEYATSKIIATTEAYETADSIIPNGISKVFFSNGLGYMQVEFLNGLRNGEQTWHNEAGDIYAIYKFKVGVLNGPFIRYNDSTGWVLENGLYENGCRTGLWLRYYPNRTLRDSGYYLADVNYLNFSSKSGLFTLTNKDKIALGNYPSKHFNLDSFLVARGIEKTKHSISFPIEVFFKQGVWKYYNIDGSMMKEEYYENGILKSKFSRHH